MAGPGGRTERGLTQRRKDKSNYLANIIFGDFAALRAKKVSLEFGCGPALAE